jgi:pimeloyl-ACP methyl ester carboxylesterase
MCALCAAKSAASPPEPGELVVDGVKIRYWTQGSGSPVLLIHGAHSSAAGNWIKPGIMAALARNHRVVALDLPGYGGSDKPDDPRAYGRQWVADAAALLDHLAIPKAHIVGYSMGGFVALKFAAEHPDRALSGTLGGSGWLREGGLLAKGWARLSALTGRGVAELGISKDALAAMRTPVEVVAGSRDFMRLPYVAPLSKARADWPVVIIPGVGHVGCVVDPRFRDELARWIDANDAKPSASAP